MDTDIEKYERKVFKEVALKLPACIADLVLAYSTHDFIEMNVGLLMIEDGIALVPHQTATIVRFKEQMFDRRLIFLVGGGMLCMGRNQKIWVAPKKK